MPEDQAELLRPKIAFFYSPLVEMLLSLHVLHDPERHGVLLPWMVRFREKISPETMRELRFFGDHGDRWINVAGAVLNLEGVQELGVPGMIRWLHSLDEPSFLARLLGGRVETAEVRAVLGGEESADALLVRLGRESDESREALEEFLGDVAGTRARLATLLSGYWDQYFGEEFYWIELLLIRSIKEASIELERSAPREFLARLSTGALAWDGEGRLLPRAGGRAGPREMAGLDRIQLFPSVFVYPETLVVNQPRRVLSSYPVSPGVYLRRDSLNPPENLSLLLKVLADDTRLKILKLMAEKRRFTQELASELDLAEPTVSRHIKLLREAELITSEKEGNYIYYSLRLERVAEVQTRLLDFFRS
ncbi:MAG: metalloregulator ArsR/SmtB family transcription factor [bacterium]|nr:metalloregulator ArsR/SmtB family transcription factor [bacterium]